MAQNRLEIEIGVNDAQARRAVSQFSGDLNKHMESLAKGAGAASSSLGNIVGQLGPAKLLLGAAAAGVGSLAMQWFDLAKAQSNAAEQMVNMADRTGLTLAQVDRLQAMAQIAGVNINSLNSAAKSLSTGLADTSANGTKAWRALTDLGVSTVDLTGKQRDLGQVTLDVIERLGHIENAAKRNALATQALGKGAVELLPLIKNYQQLDRTVRELGFGTRDGLIKELAEANDKLDVLGLRWDILKGKLATPLNAVINVVTNASSGPNTVSGPAGSGLMVVPDFLVNQFFARSLGAQIPGVGDPASAAMAADRGSAARAFMNADPRRRLASVSAELAEAQRRALAGESGALQQFLNLDREKASLEKLIRDLEETKRQREKVLEVSARISERYGDLVAGGMGKRGSATGGDFFRDLSTSYLLDKNYSDTRIRTPFDAIGLQGQIAQYALDQYDELANAEKKAAAEAKRAIREQQDAYEQMFNRLRSGFETTFDSLIRNGANAAQLLRNLFLTALLTPIKQAASAMFANLFMPIAMGGRGGGGGGFSAAGAMSSGLGMAGMIGPGGTAPFVGGGGGMGRGIGSLGSIGGIGAMSGAKMGAFSAAGIGSLAAAGGGLGVFGAFKAGQSGNSALKYAAPAIGAASGMFAMGGLMAMFPSLVAMGPVGLIAAGAIGAIIGLTGMFKKTAEQKARDKIKTYYGIDISDKGILSQIVGLAKQSYGGNLDVAVRAREIRDLIELYAMSTGQNIGTLNNRPMGVNLSQMGGSIYQTGSYSNGVGYSYGGSIAPVAGLSRFTTPTAAPIILDSEGTKAFWSDVMATGIVQNPRAVQAASLSAQSQNYGRTSTAVNLTDPLGATI